MRLAVLSDTHLRAPTSWFEAVYEAHLASADMVIHCGDAVSLSVWSYLLQHPRFEAVAGNCDAFDLAGELPSVLDLSLAGRRVAVTHGWGPRPGLAARLAAALGPGRDIIFFGHSHAAADVRHGAVRCINPGPCQPGGSLALVDCDQAGFAVRFVDV